MCVNKISDKPKRSAYKRPTLHTQTDRLYIIKKQEMRNIENLVFKGGGVLGVAYAGSIQALHEAKILDNIKGVAGTSAGSIVAALLSLRFTSSEIKKIVAATNFNKFEDHRDSLRIPTKYGLYKGEYFLSWIKDLIKQKTNNENITFSELSTLGYRNLKVFATDLNTTSVREFSNEKTPNVVVAESIRASMSIPFFFSAWKFPKNNPNNHIYVDGGIVYNYPITAFKDSSKTLGFFLYSDETEASDLGYNQLIQYVKVLFKTLIKSQDIEFNKNVQENEISVKINSFGVSTTDFNISSQMKEQLYYSGLEATTEYIKNYVQQ